MKTWVQLPRTHQGTHKEKGQRLSQTRWRQGPRPSQNMCTLEFSQNTHTTICISKKRRKGKRPSEKDWWGRQDKTRQKFPCQNLFWEQKRGHICRSAWGRGIRKKAKFPLMCPRTLPSFRPQTGTALTLTSILYWGLVLTAASCSYQNADCLGLFLSWEKTKTERLFKPLPEIQSKHGKLPCPVLFSKCPSWMWLHWWISCEFALNIQKSIISI